MIPGVEYFLGGWGFSKSAVEAESLAQLSYSIHEFSLGPVQTGQPSEAAAQFAAELAGRPPGVVLAWSTGAMIALDAAAHFPDCLSGLVLMAATPSFVETSEFEHGVPLLQLRALRSAIKRDRELALRAFFKTVLHPSTQHENLLEFWLSQSGMLPDDTLIGGLAFLESYNALSTARRIRVPTLLLHGAQDEIVPEKAGALLAELIPQAEFVEYKDVGHYLLARGRDKTLSVIEGFAARCRQ